MMLSQGKIPKYIIRLGGVEVEAFYIHSKVVTSKEAVASDESGEADVVDRRNAMA